MIYKIQRFIVLLIIFTSINLGCDKKTLDVDTKSSNLSLISEPSKTHLLTNSLSAASENKTIKYDKKPQDPILSLPANFEVAFNKKIKLPKNINRKWVESDLNMILNFRQKFPMEDDFEKTIIKFPDNASSERPKKLGLGYQILERSLYAGYGSCSLKILSGYGKIAEVRLSCDFSKKIPAEIFSIYKNALGDAFTYSDSDQNYYAKNRFRFDNYESLLQKFKTHLGHSNIVPIPPELKSEFEYLTDPYSSIDVGSQCYISGQPPDAYKATLALMNAGRVDLIRQVLRGLNPAARVYAFYALDALGKIDNSDQQIIDTLAKDKLLVSSCSGCIVSSRVFKFDTSNNVFNRDL
ncbi:MAG: hypothetical protein JXR91_08310 [Deltaproteobacteria bacterium]|nr:hypothetical protein [Deltaproteobacteria bacterium]